jgi:hypothetical protein
MLGRSFIGATKSTAKTMGGMIKEGAMQAPRSAGTFIGAALWARKNPLPVTALALGAYGIMNYDGTANQSITHGPTSVGPMPSATNQGNNQYDLGARGDLVFALGKQGR